ncbi:MAG: conjugal transfer protein TraO [Flavobacteriales bacterium]
MRTLHYKSYICITFLAGETMKKRTLLLTILFLSSLLSQAQIEGERAVDAGLGYEANGLYARGSFAIFTGNDRFWRLRARINLESFNASGSSQDTSTVSFSAGDVPVKLYTASLEHYRNLLNNGKSLKLYLGGGLVAGYELINDGKEFMDNGRKLMYESKFVYGATAAIETDVLLFTSGRSFSYKDFSWFVNAGYTYYVNSDVGEVQPNISTGIRMIF